MDKRIVIYEAPKLDVYHITTERGFAQSLEGDITDYGSSGNDLLDD
jgi:hypothetical protein